jgi:ribonuclease Z
LSYPIQVHTVQPGVVYEDEEFTVSCGSLEHRITAFGYRIVEKDRPGALMSKSEALSIPQAEFTVC